MIDITALGKRILEKRKAKGFTQEQLGSLLGVTAQAVSRWENGDSSPDLGLIPDLCRTLGVNSDNLLGLTDESLVIGELKIGQEKHRVINDILSKLKCTFCGKCQDEVKKLIAGPGVYICNECVVLCNDIISEVSE